MRQDLVHKFFEGKRHKNGVKIKTRQKLDPRKDYEEDDYWAGQALSPCEVLGWGYKEYGPSTNWRLIDKLLSKFLHRPWDEFYSELCKVAPANSYQGYELRDSVNRMKSYHPYWGYYVDDEGIIQHKDRPS